MIICSSRLPALVAALAAMAAATTSVDTATAAGPHRHDSVRRPVYIIHGYGHGHDCRSRWGAATSAWRRHGWRGPLLTVAYHAGDRHCSLRIGRDTRNTSITTIGRQLARSIYRRYTRHGVPVDIVAHSMGGLIARAALAGVQDHAAGFPRRLLVEDVATLGTPYGGVTADWVDECSFRQCVQMRPGSQLLSSQPDEPQSSFGTDWTLIGSRDDETVSWRSAIAMRAGHKLVYSAGQDLGHSSLPSSWQHDHTYHVRYANYWDEHGWRSTARGRSPVIAAGGAIRHWRKW